MQLANSCQASCTSYAHAVDRSGNHTSCDPRVNNTAATAVHTFSAVSLVSPLSNAQMPLWLRYSSTRAVQADRPAILSNLHTHAACPPLRHFVRIDNIHVLQCCSKAQSPAPQCHTCRIIWQACQAELQRLYRGPTCPSVLAAGGQAGRPCHTVADLLLCSDMRCSLCRCSRFSICEMRLRPNHSSTSSALLCISRNKQSTSSNRI